MQVSAGEIKIPVSAGGTELTIFELSKWLSKTQNTVTILDRIYAEHKADETIETVKIKRLCPVNILSVFPFSKVPGKLFRVLSVANRFLFSLSISVSKLTDCPEIIHIHDQFVLYSLIFLRPFDRKKFVYGHHSSTWPDGRYGTVGRFLNHFWLYSMRFLVNNVIAGMTVESSGTEEAFIKAGVFRDRIALTPPGRELSAFRDYEKQSSLTKFNIPENKVIILFVGRISREKGVNYLVEAANIIVNKKHFTTAIFLAVGPYEQFDWHGSSSYLTELTDLISRLQLSDHFKILGRVAKNDLFALYSACSVFVLPSLRETFGSVITEAMAFEKPVIATETYGAKAQIIDGWSGLLVKCGDRDDLADKLASVLSDTGLRQRLAKNARYAVTQLDWSNVVYSYLVFYEKVYRRSTS